MSKQYTKEERDNENEVLKDLEIEIMKNHLKMIFLLSIKRNGALSGYDLLQRTQDKYQVNLSPGTVYTQLYALERKNLLKGQMDSSGKRVYSLTSEGIKATDIILSSRNQIEKMFALLFE